MGTLSNDLRTLSHEAYVYLYPLVMMDLTRRQATNVEAGVRPGSGRPTRSITCGPSRPLTSGPWSAPTSTRSTRTCGST
ncbi:hypothetical protein NKG05_03345 [Oerskovia sp. M15]